MVEIDTGGYKEGAGCVVKLKVMLDKEGQLEPEELEDIHEQMMEIGSSRTGQRLGVSSTSMKKTAIVEYVYQESLHHKSIENLVERLSVFTPFDNPTVYVDTEAVRFK